MPHRWPAPPPWAHKVTAREDREARWPKTWQPSTRLMCPWARHGVPSSSRSGLQEPSVTPDLPVEGGPDKKRFSLWGLIKYHIIIWMQWIVSLSVFISACRPFRWNTWYDLVTASLLYLWGKVCRPKCQMIKEQSAMLYASHLSVLLSAFKLEFTYTSFVALLQHSDIQPNWLTYRLATFVGSMKTVLYRQNT